MSFDNHPLVILTMIFRVYSNQFYFNGTAKRSGEKIRSLKFDSKTICNYFLHNSQSINE